MKSLIALIIVVLAAIGMLGSIWVLMHHRWPNHEIRAQFDKVTPADISEIRIEGELPEGPAVRIANEEEIGKVVEAFRLADRPRADNLKDMTIIFKFKGRQAPLEYKFGKATIENDLGQAVAAAVNPYIAASPPR